MARAYALCTDDAVIGTMFLGEQVSPLKVVSLALIVFGVVGLNLAGAH